MDRKHPLAKCEECPLQQVGRYVGSTGPGTATLAFVGEAPGTQEARTGIPFSGPSGRLLDTINNYYGIKREEVFLSNACLCRPPDKSPIPKMAIQACKERLLAELTKRNVSTVVALGNSAAESLLGKTGVTKLRVGPGRTTPLLPGVRIIPTLHPAAALRQADLFPFIVTDIGKVDAPRVIWNEPEYIVADNAMDACNLLSQVESRTDGSKGGTGFVVIDIEVDVEKDFSFAHPNQYGMLCTGIGYAPGKVLVLGESAMGIQRVRDQLRSLLRARRIVGQNGKFDLQGLYPLLGGLELWFDTMLASYVCDERPGIHGLKIQASEYLGAPDYANDIKQYIGPGIGYGAIPRPKLYKYNAIDVASTYSMHQMWSDRFDRDKSGNLRRVHDFLVAASNQLMYLELNGLAVDRSYLKILESEFIASLGVLRQDINQVIGVKDYEPKSSKTSGLNPNSPQQVNKFLADHGIKVDSTNADTIAIVIERLSKKDFEGNEEAEQVIKFCNLLLKHRKEAKSYGTYVKGIRKRLYRGRVYPSFLLHGTTTGRLSCRNPNLQNIPRESSIRRLFIPGRPEHVFIQVDYSQAELRVLSYLAGDHYFQDIFNSGERDIFDELTPIVFPGADRGLLTATEWKELRVRVKAYVYGLAYGRTAEGLAFEYDFSIKEARKARDNFFEVIPEIVEFLSNVRRDVRSGLDLVTPWGRHRRFGLITVENVKDIMNQAQAFLPQSTASDMCLAGMVEVRKDTKGFAWIRNIVHDSLLIECHPDNVERVTEITERRMLESFDFICGGYVKGAVETKVGKNWGEV